MNVDNWEFRWKEFEADLVPSSSDFEVEHLHFSGDLNLLNIGCMYALESECTHLTVLWFHWMPKWWKMSGVLLDVFSLFRQCSSFPRGFSGLICCRLCCLKESINFSYLIFMKQMVSSRLRLRHWIWQLRNNLLGILCSSCWIAHVLDAHMNMSILARTSNSLKLSRLYFVIWVVYCLAMDITSVHLYG